MLAIDRPDASKNIFDGTYSKRGIFSCWKNLEIPIFGNQ